MTNVSMKPLRCVVRDDGIDMGIGADALAFAAASHPEYWDGKSGPDVPNIKVDGPADFAREVCAAINREDEDGSTLLTRMLDKAISMAVESGCDGVDHDWWTDKTP